MDRLARTVREQLALGRLLPLGEAGEALWIAESAAGALLRRAAGGVAGVRLGDLGVRLAAAGEGADGSAAGEGSGAGSLPGVAPAGALPHAPLRVTAGFDAAAGEPLPQIADRLRTALWTAVRDGLGAQAAAVDLRVTGLFEPASERDGLDGASQAGGAADGSADVGPAIVEGETEACEAAVRAVPGVARLTRRLSGFGPGVAAGPVGSDGSQSWEVRVQVAVLAGWEPVAVARAAATAAAAAVGRGGAGAVTTAVVVTDA